MQASELLQTLTRYGAVVSAEGNQLAVEPRSVLTDALRAEIRANKSELVVLLSSGEVVRESSAPSQALATQASAPSQNCETEPRPALRAFLDCVDRRRRPDVPNLINISKELTDLWKLAQLECGFRLDLAGNQLEPLSPEYYARNAVESPTAHENQADTQTVANDENGDSVTVSAQYDAASAYAEAARLFRRGKIDATQRDFLQNIALAKAPTNPRTNLHQPTKSEDCE